ncbi:Dihydroorotate dehydrogenase [Gorgonomyces haynaldii]|nr:Dihydroorotate dehydrogenase [Gorgonomyces haynaldii]
MPIMHRFDPEQMHRLSILLLPFGPKQRQLVDLKVDFFGKQLQSPIGIAAGYDKHAEAMDALFDLGFGTVEIGSVTPKPQEGNPKPRMFRLTEDEAVINRYGFNSDGHQKVLERLKTRVYKWLYWHPDQRNKDWNQSLRPHQLLGVNLGKNKTSPADSDQDYVDGIKTLGPYADYLVVNVSSPNTPGLRNLQSRLPMERLLKSVKQERDQLERPVPLLVKIAPDVSDQELQDIAEIVKQVGIDGVIISNTTISRNNLKSDSKLQKQMGGLSGKPVKPLALQTVKKFYQLTNGSVPIVGCGGIQNGQDALEFCEAGASFCQLYTHFGYYGPGLPGKINQELSELLHKRGKTWNELIGTRSQ